MINFSNNRLKWCFVIVALYITSTSYGQYGWTKNYNISNVYDVEETQDGGFYIAGSEGYGLMVLTEGTVLIRIDSEGDVIWEQRYYMPILGAGGGRIIALKELPNRGAILLVENVDFGTNLVVGLTRTGEIDWIRPIVSSGVSKPNIQYGSLGLERTSDGNFLVFDHIGSVLKISPLGMVLWSQETYVATAAYPHALSPYGHNMIELPNESFLIVGGEEIQTNRFNMTATVVDSTGILQQQILAQNDYRGVAVVQASNQDLIFCGDRDQLLNDSLVLVKTDTNLTIIWTKKHALAGGLDIVDMETTSTGDIWCLGVQDSSSTREHLIISVFDPNGNYIETRDLSLEVSPNNLPYLLHYARSQNGMQMGTWVHSLCKLIRTTDGSMVIVSEGGGHIKITSGGVINPAIEGNIFEDSNLDCIRNSGEAELSGHRIKATNVSDGSTFYGTSNALGLYTIPVTTGTFDVEWTPLVYRQSCNPVTQVTFNGQVRERVDFGIENTAVCPLMEVDMSAPFLRSTGGGSAYTISYCNNGTATATNVSVEVDLDSYLTVLSTNWSITNQNGTVYTFNIGTVRTGVCRSFQINVQVDTLAQIGQTHCSSVRIFPDSICLPNYWTGPIVQIEGDCQNDTVFFEIENVGSNMGSPQGYTLFEDSVIIRQGSVQLNAGSNSFILEPALPGKSYRLSVNQASGFPPLLGDLFSTAVIEGCVPNPNGSFNTGFVNQFSNGSTNPFIAVDCQASIAAYDPNDKSAQPEGYQSQHYIDSNTVINYKVRFQNTGTDTAFYVMIKDTLSPYLEPSSIQMGASSHAYNWRLLDNGILKVSFLNIRLVDSVANEPLSHGFFSYRIQQKKNNPVGTVINNRAAIYFDYNPPIITNTTFHTLEESFILLVLPTEKIYEEGVTVKVYPNPFKDFTTLEIKEKRYKKLTLNVYDLAGRSIQTLQDQNTSSMRIYRQNLPQGVYLYELEGDGQRISTGKIMVQAN
jgi:hypothetical protein